MSSYLQLHSEHKEHGWALRAIGQDLAHILLQYLEIEFNGQVYVAHGLAKSTGLPAPKKKSSVKKLLSKFGRGNQTVNENPAKVAPFERTYTLERIHRLGEGGKSKRKNSPLQPDINILGERLRAAGKMIEAKDGQLIKLTMDDYRVAFKYRDAQGKICEEEHTTPSLYRSQKQSQPRRLGGKQRDPWEKVRN